MNNFSVVVKKLKNAVIILPKGYVNDLGAERLEDTCDEYLKKGINKIIINFSEMQFINSIGASIFTGIIKKTLENNIKICFTNMKKIHNDVFHMLGITKHVRVFKDEQEAINFLNGA